MWGVRARVAAASGSRPGSISAVVEVELPDGREGIIYLRRLARRPREARARLLRGGVLAVELIDEHGSGFACCVVDAKELRIPWWRGSRRP